MPVVDLKEMTKIGEKKALLQSLYDNLSYYIDTDVTAYVQALEKATSLDELYLIHASFTGLIAQHFKSLYTGDLILSDVIQGTVIPSSEAYPQEDKIKEASEGLRMSAEEDTNPFNPSDPSLNNLVE